MIPAFPRMNPPDAAVQFYVCGSPMPPYFAESWEIAAHWCSSWRSSGYKTFVCAVRRANR